MAHVIVSLPKLDRTSKLISQLYGNDNSLMFTDDFMKRMVNDLVYVFYDTVLMLWPVSFGSSPVRGLTGSWAICLVCILYPQ